MTRTARKLLLINGTLGAALTLAVAVFDWCGGLESLERWFYDRRALDCQYFRRAPSGRIVHVDIDDNAIDTIGQWAWPRSVLAQIVEEIGIAGPKVVALDIRLGDPGQATYERLADGALRQVDNDAALGAAIAKLGRVLVPLSLGFDPAPVETPVDQAMHEILRADLELTPAEVATRLAERGITSLPAAEAFDTAFVAQRRAAMFARVDEAVSRSPDVTVDELHAQLLPKGDARVKVSPLLRLLEFLHDKAVKERAMVRFSRPAGPDTPSLLIASSEEAPQAQFGRAAAASGFVDYLKNDDGKVRQIPLFVRYRDRVYPQMALSVACAMLGVDPNDVRIEGGHLTIPRTDGTQVVVPVATRPQWGTGRMVGTLFEIPFFGTDDWKTMYDFPAHRAFRNHVPVNAVWQIVQTRQAIALNNATADRNLREQMQVYLGEDRVTEYFKQRLAPDDAAPRATVMRELTEFIPTWLKAFDLPDLSEEERKQRDQARFDLKGFQALLAENQRLLAQLARQRDDLQEKLGGRAVLIGSVAGGIIYDFVPTTLHDKCPGVVVHGVIADAILTGKVVRRAPVWVTRLITILMGLATTAFVCFLTPRRAAVAAIAVVAVYFVLNGILLYDYFGLIVGVAGPVVAMLLAWVSCQLVEIVIVQRERSRIRNRFSTYVDPALVDFVIEQGVTSGQTREMTVVFTDLAGFTTISEALKENVIPLLNDYLGLMSSIIKKHRGFVNKFLGDGIMFFYNAPRDNPAHAIDAVETVLEMQEALVPFNADLVKRGLPKITMRAGIATGSMVVGDAGGDKRSDYTVIGDNVNLAARLESANKATDTKLMMTARTCELLGDRFLFRPTARLTVKGKTEGVDTCEVICRAEDATDEQRRVAGLWRAVFDAFVAADFAGCLRAVEDLEAEFGKTKLTAAYRELCEQYLKEPPGAEFGGEIVLHEK